MKSHGALALTSTLTALAALAALAPPAFAANQTLKVSVTGPGSVSANEGIVGCTESGGAFCEAQYSEGATITLTATPTARSTFAGWTVVGHPGACPRLECEVTMNAAKEVKASFTPIAQEALTVNTTEGTGEGTVTGTSPGLEFTPINCVNGTGTCEATYNQGAKLTLTATPANEKTSFAGWSGGGCSGHSPTCEVTLSTATEVKAEFSAIAQEALTVTDTEGTGVGTVSGTSPGGEFTPIECGSTCTAQYNQSAKVTLTATPTERSTFAGWSGACAAAARTCEVTMSAATEVKAEFTPIPQQTLTVTTEGPGTLSGSQPGGEFTPINCVNGTGTCEASYNQSATITLTATPTERSTFAGWSGACAAAGTAPTCEVTMSAAESVKAEFAPIPQQTLTVTTEGPGTVSGSQPGGEFTPINCVNGTGTCEATYDEGAKITLTATTNERSTTPILWTGCTNVPSETECEVEIGSTATEVKAEFEPIPQQTLTVTTEGPGTVTGTSPGGEFTPIECGNGPTTCEATYDQGATVILTAGHNERTTFAGWTGCPHELSATECEVEMSAAKSVKAEFEPILQQALSVEVTGEGTLTGSQPGGEFTPIECGNGPTTCEATYNEGAKLTLTANRAPHNSFLGWSGACAAAGTAPTCEVEMSTAKSVKAEFDPIPQQVLTVEVIGPGKITSSPAGIACTSGGGGTCAEHFDAEGPESTVTLTATPNPHSHLVKWLRACSGVGACQVTISAATEVKAEFAPTFQSLAVSRSGNGTITSSPAGIDCGEDLCEAQFQEGSLITLTAHPAPHNHFIAWGAGQCKAESGPNHEECEVEIGSATTEVSAEFAPITHTLIVVPQGGGAVSASEGAISACAPGRTTCSGTYDEASTLTLTATPFPHHSFHAWGAGQCKAESGPNHEECEVEIGSATTEVSAEFAPITQTLTLTPTGPGSVSAASGAISHCTAQGGTCAGPYIEAATVALTATPAPHQAVAWQGCTAVPSPDRCEVEIGASETNVKASFAQIAHALTAKLAGSGQGSVACNGGPCATSYPEGTALTLTAAPGAGSTFAGWSGAGCSGTGACELTLNADTALTATFNANPPPPPTEEKCVVPHLAGKTLGQARSALGAAHCSLGKVTKPKSKKGKGKSLGPLVIRSSSPAPGATLPAAGQVNLKLGPKPKH